MSAQTRTDFLNEKADARLETAITGAMSDYRAGWVSGSAGVTDTVAQLELRREVVKTMLKRLMRMDRRSRTHGATA